MSSTQFPQPTTAQTLQQVTLERLQGRTSSSKHVIQRLFKGDVSQRFGRFYFVRKGYSAFQNLRQRTNAAFYQNRLAPTSESLFEGLPISTCIQELEKTGVFLGLQLPKAMVDEILHHALTNPCTEPGYEQTFQIGELNQGYLPDGHQVLRALVGNLGDCQAITQLVHDPILLQVVRNYLHYWPTQITQHLTWSIATQLPEQEVQKYYPPTTFHYDIAGYNFATVYFYITPVLDDESAPHIMINGSHHHKPLRMLLSGGRHCDSRVYSWYSKNDVISIKGEAGFGFVQDPSCLHKLKPPVKRDRLLLQIRYS